MFLQEKLKSIKLTKLVNILLHNNKKLLYTGYFFNVFVNIFVTLSNGKQRPLEAEVPCDDNLNY